MNISSTTWKILKLSKSPEILNYSSLREVLISIYHPDMAYSDVVSILLKSLAEVMAEPRFKIHYGDEFLNRCIIAPLKVDYADKQTMAEAYGVLIIEILYGFRFTTADWCREELSSVVVK